MGGGKKKLNRRNTTVDQQRSHDQNGDDYEVAEENDRTTIEHHSQQNGHVSAADDDDDEHQPIVNGLVPSTSSSVPVATTTTTATVACSTDALSIDDVTTDGVSSILLKLQRMSASRRIETLVKTVQAMTPLELRYIGACIESVGRKDSPSIRDWELKLNDADHVRELVGTCTQREMISITIIGLAVLHSTNRLAAGVYANFILSLIDSFDDILTTDGVNDWIELVDQLRLLMTVAMYHPTFRIEQRLRIYEARIHLDKILHSRQSQSINNTPISSGNNCSSTFTHFVLSINVETPTDESTQELICQIKWTDGIECWCVKSFDDIRHLHLKLLEAFPCEAGYRGADRLLPYLSQLISDQNSTIGISHFVQYLRQLSDLPARVLLSPVVTSFFLSCRPTTSANSTMLMSPSINGDDRSSTAVLSMDSLTISPASVEKNPPSCPNCASDEHSVVHCRSKSMYEIAASGDYHLKWNCDESATIDTDVGGGHIDKRTRSSHRTPTTDEQ